MRTSGVAPIAACLLVCSAIGAVGQSDPSSRPPIPSAGCGAWAGEPGRTDGSMDIQGVERTYSRYVPEAHDGQTPRPLWLQLHGGGGNGFGQIFTLQSTAKEHGIVLAAPDDAEIGSAGWTWKEDDPELDTSMTNEDIAFIDALLDRLEAELCIDLARVYAAGYSAGGEGSSVLGCVLEDRLAAVAPVAAMLDVGDACDLDRPVPFIAIHGTADRTAKFDGGYGGGYDHFPVVQALAQASIPDRVANVAQRNGCAPEPTSSLLQDGVERWTWDCPPEAATELIAIEGGRHEWPRGWGDDFDANSTIWAFFEQHPMPE